MTERPRVTDWATDWDPQGRQYHDEAVEVWEELRARCPVAHTERFGGAWLPVNYADVMAVAQDTATYSSRVLNLFDVRPDRLLTLPPITMDPPQHADYRRLMLSQFTVSAVSRFYPDVEALCDRLIDAFIADGHTDAGMDYAQHVPVAVTAWLLGLPESDGDRFRAWIHDVIEVGQNRPEVAASAYRELQGYFREQLTYRRDHPGDDLVSLLVDAAIDGEPLNERTKAAMLHLLLVGGIDTTWSVLGASLWHLATHPDDQARLRQEPKLLDTALEEFLRFYAPVEIGRIVTQATALAGCPIAEDDQVWLSFPAANRDSAVFPDADRFVLDRHPNRQIAFGVGVHNCIGKHLARMELRAAIATWMRRMPPFTVQDGATIGWTTGGTVRGPRVIPVAF
jgi:cytochrome P450